MTRSKSRWPFYGGALARLLWTLEPNATGGNLSNLACAPQPKWRFTSDANTDHAFGIFMTSVGPLRPSALV